MQARKRERKRMKRKAKQQKERLEKETLPLDVASCSTSDDKPHAHINSHGRTASPVCVNDVAGVSSNEHSPTLSRVVRHIRKASLSSQRSNDSLNDNGYVHVSSDSPRTRFPLSSTAHSSRPHDAAQSNDAQTNVAKTHVSSESMPCTADTSDKFARYSPTLESPSVQPHPLSDSSACSTTVSTALDSLSVLTTGTQQPNSTEVKREKHRNKKHSQRAAKRAAGSSVTDTTDKTDRQAIADSLDSINTTVPVTSIYYSISPNGDSEVNWSALIESQSAQFDQYLTNGFGVASTESSNWTVVVPSGSARTQRGTGAVTNASTRSNADTSDWKTNSSSGSFKRRLSIPVSRHDIGKVIGQGGAVVSALRNMSGIQIDIESARSDEVTERMVFLKGPNEAVVRTYETIQGLLTGSIAGNDVLLMYAALKESTPSSASTAGKAMLTALNSKVNGPITLTVSSGATKTSTSTGRSSTAQKAVRKTGKSATSSSVSSNVPNRSIVSSGNVLALSRTTGLTSKTISAATPSNNNNSNSAVSTNGIMASSSSTPTWSSKLLAGNSSRGNFASVAAAGLITQSMRPIGEKPKASVQNLGKYGNVPNLMSSIAPAPASSGPVSLLSLNFSPFSTSSSMFSDLGLSVPSTNDVPDSLDEVSFPPLNSSSKNVHPIIAEKEPSRLSPVLSVSNTSTCDSENIDVVKDYTPSAFSSIDANVIHCYPSLTTSGSDIPSSNPLSIFNPLTISPPTVTASRNSQSHTPVGSGDIQPSVSLNTPTTVSKSFPLAPGSERSAHHRNATASSTGVVSSGDAYPSLLSLDGGVKLSSTGVSCLDGALLLTPTKRAISPEINDPEFHQHSIRTRFRPDTESDWRGAELTPNAGPTFTTSSSFGFGPQPSTELMSVNANTLHQSILGSPASTAMPNTGSSRIQLLPSEPSRRPSLSLTAWPFQTDLNSNPMSYQQSAFQPPSGPSLHQPLPPTATNLSVDGVPSASMQMEYPDINTSASLSGGYLLKSRLASTRNAVNKTGTSLTPMSKPPVSLSQMGNLNTHGVHSTADLLSPLPSSIRHKAFLSSLSNMYPESRSSVLNGFSSNVDPSHQLSSPAPGSQISSLFPRVPQPHASMGSNSFTALAHQQQSNTTAVSSRLGHSPHSLLTPAQMGQFNCQSASINSYTPPPYLTSFAQSGSAAGQGSTHTGTYPTHLLNGSVYGNGSLLGTSGGSMNPSVPTPAPIQPIGAERRRQTVSTAPSSVIYPSTVTNGSGSFGTFSVANMGVHNQPPNVSPPQPATSSATNNMLMALTMNWMQQQQQQLALNQSGSPNPPTNWQSPPSIWPTNNATPSYPSGSGSINAPPGKMHHSGLPDPNTYGNTSLLSNNLSAGGSSSGQNQQQSMVAAAMAAMANIYPWNNSNTGSGASGQMNAISTPSMGAGAGQTRWMYPSHFGSNYTNTTANPMNAYYSDQLPTNIKSTSNTAAPPSLHRPSHE